MAVCGGQRLLREVQHQIVVIHIAVSRLTKIIFLTNVVNFVDTVVDVEEIWNLWIFTEKPNIFTIF